MQRRSFTCRIAVRSTIPSGTSQSGPQRDRRPGFRRKAMCSAASITTGRSRPRCSASGYDSCMQSKAACYGCSATTRVRSGTCVRKRSGIDPARLVFAGRLPLEDHLARHRLADLFLDTLPCNAHTTASDALWVGLPVLTRIGNAFAGRVAASLLNAIGLPELVTHSIEDYEALALRLAKDPSLLEGYRNRLAANRLTHPLFDIDRFRRHIEAAYLQMWEIWQRGEQPRSFAVEALHTQLPARQLQQC